MNNGEHQNQEPRIPDDLREALLRLNRPRVVVPPAVDRAILQAAREHLERVAEAFEPAPQTPPLRELSWWTAWRAALKAVPGGQRCAALGATAAILIVAGTLVWWGQHPRSTAELEDLNGDGAVDMLDAFALARALPQMPASHPQFDFNGDGVTDERDVRTLAARAVSLESRGRL
ncbi:MAG: hypothetical protein KJ072_14000 [Verrucomicrobia bacterium]|nr:hypothetical protein [Verrucomicrobiota bacterium]